MTSVTLDRRIELVLLVHYALAETYLNGLSGGARKANCILSLRLHTTLSYVAVFFNYAFEALFNTRMPCQLIRSSNRAPEGPLLPLDHSCSLAPSEET